MNVLVTARMFGWLSDRSFEVFQENGHVVVPNPYRGKGLNQEQLLELIPGVDALLSGLDQVTARVIAGADRLKVISKFGAGVDNVDIPAATGKGIVVTNSPGASSNAVADMAFALMLSLARMIPRAGARVVKGEWPLMVGAEVWNKTLGLVGAGQYRPPGSPAGPRL